MKAQSSLIDFVKWSWPILEQGHPFVDGKHIHAIAEHLEAVSRQELPDLVINVPPACMKSLLTSVMWPAWVWTWDPASRWITSSYAQSLSVRDAMKMRRLIESQQYRENWGNVFELQDDQNAKHNYANTKGGYRISTSVDGSNTGEGGNYIMADDAHNAKEVMSDASRESVLNWWRNVMSTRQRPPNTGGRLCIMQRLHDRDLTGLLIEKGWMVLRLPMEFERGDRCVTVKLPSSGDKPWQDWREKEGELLWPEMFGPKEIARTKLELESSYAIASQLQQRPSPQGGGIIKWDWWQLWGRLREERESDNTIMPADGLPPCHYKFLSIDTAYEIRQQNDYSACTVWGIYNDGTQNRVILLHAWRARLEFPDLIERIEKSIAKYKPHKVIIEKKASGASVRQELQRRLGDEVSVEGREPKGDKAARLNAASGLFEHGLIYAPDYPWADMVIDECARFPAADHDDLVDTVSQAIQFIRSLGIKLFPEDEDRESGLRPPSDRRRFY